MAGLGLQMIVRVNKLRVGVDIALEPGDGRVSGDGHLALAAFNVAIFNGYMRTTVLCIGTILQFK
jgi:hypothetical protein